MSASGGGSKLPISAQRDSEYNPRVGGSSPPPLPNSTFIINNLHPIARRASLSVSGPGYHLGYQSAPDGCETVPT